MVIREKTQRKTAEIYEKCLVFTRVIDLRPLGHFFAAECREIGPVLTYHDTIMSNLASA